jgi:hypothetical protein
MKFQKDPRRKVCIDYLLSNELDKAYEVYQQVVSDTTIKIHQNDFVEIRALSFIKEGRLSRHPIAKIIIQRNQEYVSIDDFKELTSLEEILALDDLIQRPWGAWTMINQNREDDLFALLKRYSPDKIRSFFVCSYHLTDYHQFYRHIPSLYTTYKDILAAGTHAALLIGILHKLVLRRKKGVERDVKEVIEFLLHEIRKESPEVDLNQMTLLRQAIESANFPMVEILYDLQFSATETNYAHVRDWLKEYNKEYDQHYIRMTDVSHPVWKVITGRNYKRFQTAIAKMIQN